MEAVRANIHLKAPEKSISFAVVIEAAALIDSIGDDGKKKKSVMQIRFCAWNHVMCKEPSMNIPLQKKKFNGIFENHHRST